jgi:prepilin-type N-terminal cleavage/methylation domain-containing protein/prepilin-type processing-associated H-X9-DG protein
MRRRRGFTWPELVVSLIVIAVLVALVLPAIQAAREKARRNNCANNMKQIGLAIHNYAQANRVFPPGTICTTGPIAPHNQYDVWAEATQTGSGAQGTSFLLRILPYMGPSQRSVYKSWNYSAGGVGLNAGVQSAPGPAATDIPEFYCPVRRYGLRPQDKALLPATWWPGGGTDYGGCVGRHVAYDTSGPSHNVLDAGAPNAIVFDPGVTVANPVYQLTDDGAKRRWGIFGRVNVGTTFGEIKDGTSNTIMTGELQRITVANAGYGGINNLSHDGWAVGGDATGFTMGYGGPSVKINGQPTPLMNNGLFQSPGSDHAGGANFGMADGSVTFLPAAVDQNIFALLGSMADVVATNVFLN